MAPTDRPLCKCHGEPMWRRNDRPSGWRCAVRGTVAEAKYAATDRGRERQAHYDHSVKGRERRRRYNQSEIGRVRQQLYELTRVRIR